jgi:hypothetical protein
MAVETGWMAAAETQTPEATKALAEREASMDGKPRAPPSTPFLARVVGVGLAHRHVVAIPAQGEVVAVDL